MFQHRQQSRLTGSFLFAIAATLVASATITSTAQTPEAYYPPAVESQVRGLSVRGDAMGFHIGDSPDPSTCYHYQAVARAMGTGTPYFFVTKSGNQPDLPCLVWCSGLPIPCTEVGDGPGNILVVRMASRGSDGERLRSNRLARNTETGSSTPPSEDTVVAVITLDGTDGWPYYGHAGGMQVVGDVLAVALEVPYSQEDIDGSINQILFIDVSNPEDPQPLSSFEFQHNGVMTAGVVGIAPQPSGRYLMLITGKDGGEIRIFESEATRADGTTDLHDPALTWTQKDTYYPHQEPIDPPCIVVPPTTETPGYTWSWPDGGTLDYAHQNLNFVREGGPNGPLFLIGTRNDVALPGYFGTDWVDAYSVNWDGQNFSLGCVENKNLDAYAASDGALIWETKIADFAAGSGVYVSPTGELIVYGTEHDNDGPNGTVKMGEWRLRDMVVFGSPTLDPTVVTTGPYTVPEGGSAAVSATASPPRTKAWVQLWADRNFSRDDRYLVIDYPDWTLDDFDDFKDLDDANNNPFATGFSDQASSARWFAPVGCTIRLNDDDFGDDSFPGDETKTLHGTGQVELFNNLDDVSSDNGEEDLDDGLTSAQFFPNCDAYYNPATLQVAWDMNDDGTFETPGPGAWFSALNLDGPTTATATARTQHPSDGRTGFDAALVTVTNVPPLLGSVAVTDGAGRVIGGTAEFALVGLPLTLTANFTDPGRPDTQAASIEWGDGTTSLPADLDEFGGATGGVIGHVKDVHAYMIPGDFPATLRVVDDDGGEGSATTPVRVLDARGAIVEVIADLDVLIANASGAGRKALVDARNYLDGNLNGFPANGAVDKLDGGDLEAAVVMIGEAIDALSKAEAATGLNLNVLQGTLALAAQSIAVEAQADAIAANTPPSPGEAKQLATIASNIQAGAAKLAAGDYAGAVDMFHDAVKRSVALL